MNEAILTSFFSKRNFLSKSAQGTEDAGVLANVSLQLHQTSVYEVIQVFAPIKILSLHYNYQQVFAPMQVIVYPQKNQSEAKASSQHSAIHCNSTEDINLSRILFCPSYFLFFLYLEFPSFVSGQYSTIPSCISLEGLNRKLLCSCNFLCLHVFCFQT